ncbi:hypothetical protein D3C71_1556800 [compost metagenome]
MPKELIIASPPAAAMPPRNAEGRGQNMGKAVKKPIVARVNETKASMLVGGK